MPAWLKASTRPRSTRQMQGVTVSYWRGPTFWLNVSSWTEST